MIVSFADKEAAKLFEGRNPRRLPPNLHRRALRQLLRLHAATNINEMRTPPSNRLEALKGARKGQYSIRVNDQWRICFRWAGNHAHDVEIVDYH